MVNKIEARHLNSSIHTSWPRTRTYITIKDYNNLINNISFVETITDNSKVFFSESAVFPREMLRIYGKDKNINTIRDRHKSDYIVVGNNKITDLNYTTQKLYSYSYINTEGGIQTVTEEFLIGYENVIPDENRFKNLKFIDDIYVIRDVKETELLISYINSNNSKFITTENLNDQCLSSTIINYEGYCNLTSMLQSTDESIQNLAISVMSSCNKKLSEFYIAKLYLENKNTIIKSSRWNTVICRGFKSYIDTRFWKMSYYWIGNDIMLIREFIDKKLNIHLSKIYLDKAIEEFKNYVTQNFKLNATFLDLHINYEYNIKDEDKKYFKFEEDGE